MNYCADGFEKLKNKDSEDAKEIAIMSRKMEWLETHLL